MKIKVGINGYGTIGKRACTAINQQDDMEIIGVTKTRPTSEARMANDMGVPLYASGNEGQAPFNKAGIKTEGTLEDLLGKVDIIVDCTPGGVGAEYKEVYAKAGVKAIFQGGEDHGTAGVSFNSTANYQESWGMQFSRVVSCNTTGLLRTLYPLDKAFGIKGVYATLIRRGSDPGDSKSGPINAIEPSLKLPTHHGPDVQSIMPWLDIHTMAVKVPTTLMHLHTVVVKFNTPVSAEDVMAVWKKSPRICMVNGKEGIKSTAQIMEYARDLGRSRGDMFEIAVWSDGVKTVGDTLYYYQAVHQESDVVPEIVDCIRSMCKLEKDASKSIQKTNSYMGISF